MNGIGVIIQARMSSKRFPGKVLMPFCAGDSVLGYLLKKIKRGINSIPIIVATTNESADDVIVDFVNKQDGVIAFRGDEYNVLGRFMECANKNNLTKIVRVCSDNPFIDVEGLRKLIDYVEFNDVDYAGYYIGDTFSIKTHFGLWGEVVKVSALEKVAERTNEMVYLEHVTNYIYENERDFKIAKIKPTAKLPVNCSIRFTMDTESDYLNLRRVCELLNGKDDSIENLFNVTHGDDVLLQEMERQILLNKK